MLGIADECLVQQATIAKLERSSSYNLKILRRWLDHSSYGNSFLYGLERYAWDNDYKHDLVSIPKSDMETNKDLLSRLFLGSLQDHYHNLIGRHYKVSHSNVSPARACHSAIVHQHHYQISIDTLSDE